MKKESFVISLIAAVIIFIIGWSNPDKLKKSLFDLMVETIADLVYGEKRVKSTNRVNYQPYKPKPRNEKIRSSGRYFWVNDIVLSTEKEAKDIISALSELIFVYGFATVADLHKLCKVDFSHADAKYGWTNSDYMSYSLSRQSGESRLIFPKPIMISES